MQGLWDGAYGLSALSEKTRKSDRFADVFTKAALSPQLFKDPECWSGQDLIPAYPYSGKFGREYVSFCAVWTSGLPLGRPALIQLS